MAGESERGRFDARGRLRAGEVFGLLCPLGLVVGEVAGTRHSILGPRAPLWMEAGICLKLAVRTAYELVVILRAELVYVLMYLGLIGPSQ